jgi:hypothetical protein
VFRNPDADNEIKMPDAIPPAVSIENDCPGIKSQELLAIEINLIKVNPVTRQKGIRTRKV